MAVTQDYLYIILLVCSPRAYCSAIYHCTLSKDSIEEQSTKSAAFVFDDSFENVKSKIVSTRQFDKTETSSFTDMQEAQPVQSSFHCKQGCFAVLKSLMERVKWMVRSYCIVPGWPYE